MRGSGRFGGRQLLLRWLLIAACSLLSTLVLSSILRSSSVSPAPGQKSFRVLQPSVSSSTGSTKHDPGKWLLKHSNLYHRETGKEWFNGRPRAAVISLVRNEELDGILQSMRQLEHRWNRRYNYPWIFFSEKDFSEEFNLTRSLVIVSVNSEKLSLVYHLKSKKVHIFFSGPF